MEYARPNKRQEASSEATNEAHENGKVRNDHRKQNGDDNNADPEAKAPDFEFSVDRPNCGSHSVRFASEKFFLQQFTGCVIGQWIRQESLDNQNQIDDGLQAFRQIVDNLLRCV